MVDEGVISPATTIRPVVSRVSHATREYGSPARAASTTASEIWSAILSGWPSVTDSEVKRNPLSINVSCWLGASVSRGGRGQLVVTGLGQAELGPDDYRARYHSAKFAPGSSDAR